VTCLKKEKINFDRPSHLTVLDTIKRFSSLA